MGRRQMAIVLPHLVDNGGDLSKDWFVEYSVRDPYTGNMKRFREYSGFKKLKSAEERYELANTIIAKLRTKMEEGWSPFGREKVTYEDALLVQKYAERWGREKESVVTIRTHLSEFLLRKKNSVTEKSYQTYRSKLRIFCEWTEQCRLDAVHVGVISEEHVCEFLRCIAEDGNLSRLTIQKYAQILHAFFDYLIKKKLLKNNPVSNIPNIGIVVDKAPRPIPEQERTKIIAVMRKYDPQLLLVCQLEYYCAIRPNECRLLQVGDVDFENKVIRVSQDKSKNRQTEHVCIPRQLYNAMLKAKLNEYNRDLYLFGAKGVPGVKPLGKNNFRNRFNAFRNRLGLSAEYKLYSFKHSGGVELVNAGVDTWELQRHFRHKSIDTTERYVRKNFAINSDKIKNHFPDM